MGVFSEGEVRVTMDNGAMKGVKPQMFHMVPGNPLLEVVNSGQLVDLREKDDGELFHRIAEGLVSFWANDDKEALIEGSAAAILLLDRLLSNDITYEGRPTPSETALSIDAGGFGAFPVKALGMIAEHYGKGGIKYSPFNWTAGYKWSFAYDAAMRHLFSVAFGELEDEDTGSIHIVAVVWHTFLLIEFSETHPEFDDRPIRGQDSLRNSS